MNNNTSTRRPSNQVPGGDHNFRKIRGYARLIVGIILLVIGALVFFGGQAFVKSLATEPSESARLLARIMDGATLVMAIALVVVGICLVGYDVLHPSTGKE